MRELNIISSSHASRKVWRQIALSPAQWNQYWKQYLSVLLHPDPNVSEDDDLDEAFVNESAFETFTGEEGEELSEVGRVAQ